MSRLRLAGLGRMFGPVPAVDNVSLTLTDGEFVSLLGPSGCGKTTTLRMIAGFIKPSSGTISVSGSVISSPERMVAPEHRGMSMIFQSYAIWPNMTVAENVAFGLTLRKMPSWEVRARTEKMLAVVRLGHLKDRYPSELSGGQQQRVALARAIVIEPAVLLLDEPLSNLDANLREEMRSEIRRLHHEFKITTVYVTHDQSEAMVTSDRIVVMNQGRIEQVDDPVSLYTKPQTRFVAGFIGRTNFLDGVSDGAEIRFDGFTVPAAGIPAGKASFSVRPQSVSIHDSRGHDSRGHDSRGHSDAWWVEAVVAERAYLGEYWDYGIRPVGSGLMLRVTAPPATSLAAGQSVWLAIDHHQAARVPSPEI